MAGRWQEMRSEERLGASCGEPGMPLEQPHTVCFCGQWRAVDTADSVTDTHCSTTLEGREIRSFSLLKSQPVPTLGHTVTYWSLVFPPFPLDHSRTPCGFDSFSERFARLLVPERG